MDARTCSGSCPYPEQVWASECELLGNYGKPEN